MMKTLNSWCRSSWLACLIIYLVPLVVTAQDYMLSEAASFKAIGPAIEASMSQYGGAFDKMNPDTPSFGIKNGGCGYGLLPKNAYPFRHACAVDPVFFGGKGKDIQCGSCYRLTAPDGKQVVVTLTDTCPGCNKHFSVNNMHFDCHASTYAAISNPKKGFVRIKAERVACKPPGGIHFKITGYSGPFQWLRVIPWQAAGDGIIRNVSVECNAKLEFSWSKKVQKMKATWGASYEVYYSPGGSMCKFTLTNNVGQTVTTELFDLKAFKGKEYVSRVNFPV